MSSSNQLIYSSLFRVALPLVLLTSVILRYNALSFIYLLLLLILPLVPQLNSESLKIGHAGRFLNAVIAISFINSVAQVVFQIVLLSLGNYGGTYDYCDWLGKVLFNTGLNNLKNIRGLDGVRLLGMDFLVLVGSIALKVICKKIPEPLPVTPCGSSSVKRRKRNQSTEYLLIGGELVYLIILVAAGITQPSLISAFYFLIFLVTTTWLACGFTLSRNYYRARSFLLLFCALQFILIYGYQFSFAQALLPEDGLAARLMGFVKLVDSPCATARTLVFLPLHWTRFANPLIVLLLYFHLATMTRFHLSKPVEVDVTSPTSRSISVRRRRSEGQHHSFSSTAPQSYIAEYLPLLNEDMGLHPTYNSIESSNSITPDLDNSLVWSTDIPRVSVSEAPTTQALNINYRQPLITLLKLFAKGSYIGTLIIMMTWSITYHSWLTFILLIGSCILWMTPRSRRNTLCTSPFLVAYAEALLLLQYIYSLDLTEAELPSKEINSVQLSEIGLIKYYQNSYQPLFIKILFTLMFWITLWFYRMENSQLNSGAVADGLVLEPFHLASELSGRPDLDRRPSTLQSNPWLIYLGQFINSILTKYWIWVVASMLMVISLGGKDVVIYRIVYMLFFLFFILMFQFSYQSWRKVLQTFWVAVIVYSMAILLLIYIYQFHGMPQLIEQKLGISIKLQNDFGLRTYTETKDLFSKLLTPTFFLIITIIQLHYFHQQFLVISEIDYKPLGVERELTQETVVEENNIHVELDIPRATTTISKITIQSSLYPNELIAAFQKSKLNTFFMNLWEVLWRFLEIHICKIVLFSLFCLAAYDPSPLHIFYVTIVLIALPFKSAQKFLCHCGAVCTSILLLAKMIYQLEFTSEQQFKWNVTCANGTEMPFNETIDNMDWIGLSKTENLVYYCRGYIGLIVVLTIQAVVRIRQMIMRFQKEIPEPPVGILFPETTRKEADSSLLDCTKYLANFMFYKFGLETCFITAIISVSVRMDIFAMITALWLFAMIFLKRTTISKMWTVFMAYQIIIIALQYLLMVGIPPGLCYQYPWAYDLREALQIWLFLPSFTYSLPVHYIVVDILLLLFTCCQARVFTIENTLNGTYEGGSNSEIYLVGNQEPNNIPDFVTYTKSYLDLLKVAVFFSFYWVTLATLFIAGAAPTRISIFALGYIVGCFFFLWNGNEFYLQPFLKLIKMWNFLLIYTILVIIFKIIFQVLICAFKGEFDEANLHWLKNLLNISCSLDTHSTSNVTSLAWDGVCFAFLLIQRRIFCSHYFKYVILEMRAQQILASRGAELINELRVKEVKEQRFKEIQDMEKIKKKMDKIRDQQKTGHYVEPKDHYQAIRSGDYYLFDEVPTVDLEALDTMPHSPIDTEAKQKGINALLSQTMKKQYMTKLDDRNLISEGEDIGESSRLSPILSVDRSMSTSTQAKTLPTSSPLASHVSFSQDHHALTDVPLTPTPEPVKPSISQEEPEPEPKSCLVSVKNGLLFLRDVMNSLFVSATTKLNLISKDYRYVAEMLTEEKVLLKERLKKGIASNLALDKMRETEREVDTKEESSLDFHKRQPEIVRCLVALWYAFISQSEIICYLVIILYQIASASLLSLPLPLMVFLWGSLSLPRPSKTFWVTIITYTEAIIVIKYMFQFNFWTWNSVVSTNCTYMFDSHGPCYVILIGIAQRNYNVVNDLMLLLAVFFHRFMLKSFGLWRNSDSLHSEEDLIENAIEESSPKAEHNEISKQEECPLEDDDAESDSSADEGVGEILKRYLFPIQNFFHKLLNTHERLTDDVYAYMFFCDFINFLILVFGYYAFGAGGASVASYFEDNKIPIPFLGMLLAQFAVIVVDRALYLRKHILGKLIFQVFTIIVIHIWMFFLLPTITKKFFIDRPPQLWYFIKCVYLLLSAYQVRSGYPIRILGNFFCKKYNYINLVLFKLYLLIPFLYELRSLMDWIWTNTSLALGNWFKMEDIFSHIFTQKCYRRAEQEYPTPRGSFRPPLIKYGMGGSILIFLILVIWFPLVLFALGNTVGLSIPPAGCNVRVTIAGFESIFTMSAQEDNLLNVTASQWAEFTELDAENQNFMNKFKSDDIRIAQLGQNSLSTWAITPPSKKTLIDTLQNTNKSISLVFTVTLVRKANNLATSFERTVSFETPIELEKDDPAKITLANMLLDATSNLTVKINNIFPRYISASDKDLADATIYVKNPYRSITLSVKHDGNNNTWWHLQDPDCTKMNLLPNKDCDNSFYIATFSDKAFPKEFSLFSGYGIIGLYTTFVLVFHRLIRSFISQSSFFIIFDDMPNVDRVLDLCLDIYLVRENQEFKLEEDLFAKMIFLYRSPETLIKWTRPEENPAALS